MNRTREAGLDLSVIIPVAPGADPSVALAAVRRTIPAGTRWEVLTVTGPHPTRQRNLAANRARGRVLLFLDHDAVVQPGTIRRLLDQMRRSGAGVAGGPNLPAPPVTPMEAALGAVISSPLGSPLVAARYGARAATGPANERSLILCNLAIEREAFLSAGGFDPRLYPNEENALLNELGRRGVSMVHVREAPVLKSRPATLRAFLRESFRYGRGRFEQIWVAPAVSDLRFVLALAVALGGAALALMRPMAAVAYLALVAAEGFRLARGTAGAGRRWFARRWGVLAIAIWARHTAYAAGMICGALLGWRSRRIDWKPMQVVLRRFLPGRAGMRLAETVSCMVGQITGKFRP